MPGKEQLISALRQSHVNWEHLIRGMSEDEIARPQFDGDWSVKDVVAHLWAWQQISVARFEAALLEKEPNYPDWLRGTDPFIAEENTEEFNSRVRETYLNYSWDEIHRTWESGFLRLIHLAERTPEESLFEAGRYAWLKGYPLSGVLTGSLEHHQEHLDDISRALGGE
jgi:hypothetical protein